jgi:hypothetical protein
MLAIAIIVPTVEPDISGADYYTWAAMLYTIASIVDGASTGMGAARSTSRADTAPLARNVSRLRDLDQRTGERILRLCAVACCRTMTCGRVAACRRVGARRNIEFKRSARRGDRIC